MRERGIVRYLGTSFKFGQARRPPVSPILRRDDGQIMVFDDDDEL